MVRESVARWLVTIFAKIRRADGDPAQCSEPDDRYQAVVVVSPLLTFRHRLRTLYIPPLSIRWQGRDHRKVVSVFAEAS